ncbi:hypothetical protein SASPL_145064 [Salvia splendens]|uniref:Uncharacterized protein n=1 Tax=Salvia splendens TaxID=180675 RepID=A0A8X8WGE6_SALSN|nr:hypothetical protein SASPL_145064 [Salvia splendens]
MDSMQSAVTLDENIALTESEWLSMKKRIGNPVERANASNFESSESRESSNVYAALVALINSELPQVGHLLVKRADCSSILRITAETEGDPC